MADLALERHDEKVKELLDVMEEKGIRNTLSVVDKMGDLHLEDDLHRALVQWIKAGYPVKGLKEKFWNRDGSRNVWLGFS
ncbi:MAG: hypothetical protein ACQESA_02235 [Patescibacteria group bacterium]